MQSHRRLAVAICYYLSSHLLPECLARRSLSWSLSLSGLWVLGGLISHVSVIRRITVWKKKITAGRKIKRRSNKSWCGQHGYYAITNTPVISRAPGFIPLSSWLNKGIILSCVFGNNIENLIIIQHLCFVGCSVVDALLETLYAGKPPVWGISRKKKKRKKRRALIRYSVGFKSMKPQTNEPTTPLSVPQWSLKPTETIHSYSWIGDLSSITHNLVTTGSTITCSHTSTAN